MNSLTNKLLVGVVSAISAVALIAPPAFASAEFSTSVSPSSHAPASDLELTVTITNTTGDDLTRLDFGFDAAYLSYISTDCLDPNNGDGVVTVVPLSVGSSVCHFHVNASAPGHYLVSVFATLGGVYTGEPALDLTITSGGVGASMGAAVSAINPTPSSMFSSVLKVAPVVALGIGVFFFLLLLRGLVSGLNKGETKLSVGYGAGPERTDLTKGIKSGKYHG